MPGPDPHELRTHRMSPWSLEALGMPFCNSLHHQKIKSLAWFSHFGSWAWASGWLHVWIFPSHSYPVLSETLRGIYLLHNSVYWIWCFSRGIHFSRESLRENSPSTSDIRDVSLSQKLQIYRIRGGIYRPLLPFHSCRVFGVFLSSVIIDSL